MNERIRKLAVECTFFTYGVNGELLYDGFNEEKFAELIVKDICDMVNKHIQWNNPNDCPLVLDIKERYGVES